MAIRIAGGPAALARALEIKPPSVIGWGEVAPIERCPAIEAATNGAVRAEDLRPDVHWVRDEVTREITGYTVPVKAA